MSHMCLVCCLLLMCPLGLFIVVVLNLCCLLEQDYPIKDDIEEVSRTIIMNTESKRLGGVVFGCMRSEMIERVHVRVRVDTHWL